MAMTGSLLVTPEQLISTSSDFNGRMQQIKQITGSMTETVKSLTGQWEGEASTAYQNKFNELQDDIAKLAAMIQEHVTDLQEMAKQYQQAEKASQELAGSLSGNVLV